MSPFKVESASPIAVAESRWTGATALLLYLAAATVLAHVLTGGRYGFQRDELATLDDARHLAWGYVAYPPVTPFFGRLSLLLFGTSLAGFRFFAALAQAVALVLTGLMARVLGGGRAAQVLAGLAAVPFALGGGALMQYVSFDYVAWALVAYFALRLLHSGDGRWWLALGAAVGFGMLSKYAMPMLVAGLVLGLLLTPERRQLARPWIWCGGAVALLVFAPNLVWEARHHFVTLDFLRHIHARDVGEGRARGFLPGQLKLTLFAAPIALAGLWFYARSPAGRRYRPVAWMYLVPLVLLIVAQGRDYYLAPAYPMLYAAGAVMLMQAWRRLRPAGRWLLGPVLALALALDIAIAVAFTLPIAPPGSPWFWQALKVNGDMHEEIGWPELVQTVARIRDALPPEQRRGLAILGTNYGEAGAVNLYGPALGLPSAISGVNSFWARGYGDPPPRAEIVLGLSQSFVRSHFAACRVAAHSWNPYGVANEETTDHPNIFVCGPPLRGWPAFWRDFRYYG